MDYKNALASCSFKVVHFVSISARKVSKERDVLSFASHNGPYVLRNCLYAFIENQHRNEGQSMYSRVFSQSILPRYVIFPYCHCN